MTFSVGARLLTQLCSHPSGPLLGLAAEGNPVDPPTCIITTQEPVPVEQIAGQIAHVSLQLHCQQQRFPAVSAGTAAGEGGSGAGEGGRLCCPLARLGP